MTVHSALEGSTGRVCDEMSRTLDDPPIAGADGPRRLRKRFLDRPSTWGYLFIAPWLLGFLIFTVGPMLTSLFLSFHIYDLSRMEYVGAENYRRLLFEDPLFWKSLRITFTYALFAVPLGVAGSLALAVLLNQKVRGIRLFRTLYYLPSLVPAVASAIVWQWVFNTDNGALNQGLMWLGLPNIAWLQDEKWTLTAFVIMSLWGIGGGRMVIFLAGLQGVPDQLLEAATIDGASPWRRFLKITMPLLSPVLFFNLVMGLIGAFQVFTSAYVMTAGGPNNASRFYALYLFQTAFEQFKLGKASAMAWILFLILVVVTAVRFYGSRKWVYYEGDKGR
jgi:multiple sugar transport system permease protein